jgi:serpin B
MTRAMHLGDVADPGRGEAALLAHLASLDGDKLQLSIADRLWGQTKAGFADVYLKEIARDFGGGLAELDFAMNPEGSRQTINAWIADQTHQRIKDLLGQGTIDELTRLVLTNAIYFKGSWVHAFDRSMTHRDVFHAAKGDVQADFMRIEGAFRAARVADASIVELPYQGSDLAMDLIVPDGKIADLEKQLSAAQLDGWFQSLADNRDGVTLTMPKFESTVSYDLIPPLAALGMKTAFGDGADFGAMGGSAKLHIGGVIHKAFIHVDEEGSEAAAATAVVAEESAAVRLTLYVNADHPFLYVIRDTRTGELLFLGRVADPTT